MIRGVFLCVGVLFAASSAVANREVNWSHGQGTFDREFDEPDLSAGWKKVVETPIAPTP